MSHVHDIAARMLAGPDGWSEAIHGDLYRELTKADELCARAGGRLISRQAISAIIVAWQMHNPTESPYVR